ncbi:MAG: UvrD-helicase domain-containing protein [Phycisphaeraceae bacterium]|nr:UvrD-helicase domain-containing protein [Phycisphaeraceae bacterium]
MFQDPQSFEESVSRRLARLQELLGRAQYQTRIHGLLLNQLSERERERAAQLRAAFSSDFLGTDAAAMRRLLGEEPDETALSERARFVQNWLGRENIASADLQQAHAIAAVQEHAIVTARAGSGKTRTLISRAAFLIRHCRVAPAQILLLAFNSKAAEEMRSRLKRLGLHCPHVMTFHALAYAIARPEGSIIHDEPDKEGKQCSALMQRVVNDFLRDSGRVTQARDVMWRHFKADYDRIIFSGVAMSREEGLLLRRSLEGEAIDGTRVKSFGEKVIANFLFEHGIRYGYERNHWWGERNYRPDFTLNARKIVIEYFGLSGDPDYDEEIGDKRTYWSRRKEWVLLEYQPRQMGDAEGHGLEAALARDLERLGVPVFRQSEEEIWQRVQARLLTRFAEVLTGLIGRCRKALLTPDALDERLRGHKFLDAVEQDVLSMASEAYRAYLARLKSEGHEDFDGLLERAARLVRNGVTRFERKSGSGDLAEMRFVMVDEYQDFSPLFDLLLSEIRSRAKGGVQVFCVGDDWQAINRFAGSDVRFFQEFAEHHRPSATLGITTNYRSARAVVDAGNRIMAGNGEPATSRADAPLGEVLLADLAVLRPSAVEAHHWQGDTITPAVRRIMHAPLKAGNSIALLARQRYLPYQVCTPDEGRYPKDDLARLAMLICDGLTDAEKEQVHVGTVHAYKGREADVVIVLDAVERRFPKVHPDWVFGRIFGDTPSSLIDDERRLFYVACSRAITRLVVVTDTQRKSPFLTTLRATCNALNWDDYEPFCPSGGDWIILVGNAEGADGTPTMARGEALKARGYLFGGGVWPHWRSRIAAKHSLEWIVENLPRAEWFPGPDGIEIRICAGDGINVARLVLVEGKLVRQPLANASPNSPATN